MELAGLIAWALDHLSYGVVFLLMLLENSVVPLPAELIVTPAAYKAANGEMDAAVLIVVSTLGSIAGAIVNYYLSLWIGRPLIYRFADSRWGRLMFLSGKKLEYVSAYCPVQISASTPCCFILTSICSNSSKVAGNPSS